MTREEARLIVSNRLLFDIQNSCFGDGSHVINLAEVFDTHADADKWVEAVKILARDKEDPKPTAVGRELTNVDRNMLIHFWDKYEDYKRYDGYEAIKHHLHEVDHVFRKFKKAHHKIDSLLHALDPTVNDEE